MKIRIETDGVPKICYDTVKEIYFCEADITVDDKSKTIIITGKGD